MDIGEVKLSSPADFWTDDYRCIHTGIDNGYTGVGKYYCINR